MAAYLKRKGYGNVVALRRWLKTASGKTDVDIELAGGIFVQAKAGDEILPEDPSSKGYIGKLSYWEGLVRTYREKGAKRIIVAFGGKVDERLVAKLKELGVEVMKIPYRGP